ncbi:MAG TPA: hypothetical protein VKY74_23740 [Chloroflexia bacterium]|nr:hypothetical protein [Chloroflexia bacterium]
MAGGDSYIFMDGCVVKGCRSVIDFEHTFGEYAALLEDLFQRGGWGRSAGRSRLWGAPNFDDWAAQHLHIAQSTQNLRTGAARVNAILAKIPGTGSIHLFGTSAAGSAMLEYFLLSDPDTLYYHSSDFGRTRLPGRQYQIDPRLASFTAIDPPANWVPLRRTHRSQGEDGGRGTLGVYLAAHTRIQAGAGCPPGTHTVRIEDVPGTWIGSTPIAGIDYDNRPHYGHLPETPLERHIYTGSRMSQETRAFLERVWR